MGHKQQTIGDLFERRFAGQMHDLGAYCQRMPAGTGFDFLVGGVDPGKWWPVECKCIADNALRIGHFTPREIVVAEDAAKAGLPYYIAYPVCGEIGVTLWTDIRDALYARRTVQLGYTHRRLDRLDDLLSEKNG